MIWLSDPAMQNLRRRRLWRKASERGPGEGSGRGGKAPKKGPPHLTDVLCLETVPDAEVRRDVDGGTL